MRQIIAAAAGCSRFETKMNRSSAKGPSFAAVLPVFRKLQAASCPLPPWRGKGRGWGGRAQRAVQLDHPLSRPLPLQGGEEKCERS
jgi:hypothetical protein